MVFNSNKKSKKQNTIENVEEKESLFESLTKIFSGISPKETTKQKDEIDNKDSFEDEPIVEESIENMNIKPSDFDFKTLFVVLFIGALIGLIYFILKKKKLNLFLRTLLLLILIIILIIKPLATINY